MIKRGSKQELKLQLRRHKALLFLLYSLMWLTATLLIVKIFLGLKGGICPEGVHLASDPPFASIPEVLEMN